jgi:hypothetical protein
MCGLQQCRSSYTVHENFLKVLLSSHLACNGSRTLGGCIPRKWLQPPPGLMIDLAADHTSALPYICQHATNVQPCSAPGLHDLCVALGAQLPYHTGMMVAAIAHRTVVLACCNTLQYQFWYQQVTMATHRMWSACTHMVVKPSVRCIGTQGPGAATRRAVWQLCQGWASGPSPALQQFCCARVAGCAVQQYMLQSKDAPRSDSHLHHDQSAVSMSLLAVLPLLGRTAQLMSV